MKGFAQKLAIIKVSLRKTLAIEIFIVLMF